jgi:hypothetical protein
VYIGATEKLSTEGLLHDSHKSHKVQYTFTGALKITSLIDTAKRIEFQSPKATK